MNDENKIVSFMFELGIGSVQPRCRWLTQMNDKKTHKNEIANTCRSINGPVPEVLFIMWKHGIWMYREYGFAFGVPASLYRALIKLWVESPPHKKTKSWTFLPIPHLLQTFNILMFQNLLDPLYRWSITIKIGFEWLTKILSLGFQRLLFWLFSRKNHSSTNDFELTNRGDS